MGVYMYEKRKRKKGILRRSIAEISDHLDMYLWILTMRTFYRGAILFVMEMRRRTYSIKKLVFLCMGLAAKIDVIYLYILFLYNYIICTNFRNDFITLTGLCDARSPISAIFLLLHTATTRKGVLLIVF